MTLRSSFIVACLLGACGGDAPAADGGGPMAGAGAPAAGAAGEQASAGAGAPAAGGADAPAGGAGAPAAGTGAPAAGAGAPAAGAPAAGSGGTGETDCQPSVDDVAVAGADRVGYPPYAANGCRLLYVASDGALRIRGLDGLSDETVAPAAERPQRPTLAGDLIAWESARDQLVRVRYGGATHDVRGDYERTAQPRATEGAVVFTGFHGDDADVAVYEPATAGVRVIASGPGQQLFADISATHIAYSDFSEDPDGRFDDNGMDVADVVLVDRATQEQRRLKLPGKQAFPLLRADGDLVYLHWAESHPEPKLAEYTIMAWDARLDARAQLARVETQPPYVRPSVSGNTVEWIERPYGADERLMRVRAAEHAEIAFSRPGLQLYATASSATVTLLATKTEAEPIPKLRAIGR